VALERALRIGACRFGSCAGAATLPAPPTNAGLASRGKGRDGERSGRRAGLDGIDIRSLDTQAGGPWAPTGWEPVSLALSGSGPETFAGVLSCSLFRAGLRPLRHMGTSPAATTARCITECRV